MCQSFLKKGNLLHKIGFFKTGVVGTVDQILRHLGHIQRLKMQVFSKVIGSSDHKFLGTIGDTKAQPIYDTH